MHPVQVDLLARAARTALWNLGAFPGRWRVESWAARNGAAFRRFPARLIATRGFSFLVDPSVSLDAYLNGLTPNSAIERIIRANVQEGDVVLDIGANLGWTMRLMSSLVGARGHVHAFEPMPHTYGNLKLNAESAPMRNVSIYRVAASDREGQTLIYTATEHETALATMRTPDTDAKQASFQVTTSRLDKLLTHVDRLDFVKIDVEGAEHLVIKGMTDLLHRHRPVLAIEVTDAWLRKLGSSSSDLLSHVRALGYSIHRLGADQLMEVDSDVIDQTDIVCVPATGSARHGSAL